MRLLFITNFYPPKQRGGYEEWCEEIANQFLADGHEVQVLTSKYLGNDHPIDPSHVLRTLNLEMDIASLSNAVKFFTHRRHRINESLSVLQESLANFRPDVALIWGMWNLPFEIAEFLEKNMPRRVAYYLGDYWPSLPPQFKNYWEAKPVNLIKGLPKSMLAIPAKAIMAREPRPKLELDFGLFCSTYLKENLHQKGIKFKSYQVVYGAIDTDPYKKISKSRDQSDTGRIKILSLGRLIPDKGIKTIILALGKLVQRGIDNIQLNIVGNGEPGYVSELKKLVREIHLDEYVVFVGKVNKLSVPDLYRQADVFVFASIWPEPFGRVIVEAMASGVAVIGTAVGGAAEILNDGENALTFEPTNVDQLSEKLECLIKYNSLKERLVQQAYIDATTKFDISRMYVEIKNSLSQLVIEA